MQAWLIANLLIGWALLSSCAAPKTQLTHETRNAAVQETRIGVKTENAKPRQQGSVTRMPLGTLFQLHQTGEVLLYDVRPSFYFRMGHIPDAINWPRSAYRAQLTMREDEIRQAVAGGKKVVLYCTDLTCPDARRVAYQLAERGHQVTVLEGGMEAWRAGELPVE